MKYNILFEGNVVVIENPDATIQYGCITSGKIYAIILVGDVDEVIATKILVNSIYLDGIHS